MIISLIKRFAKFFRNKEYTMIVFGTRSLWYEIEVDPSIVKEKFLEYFGEEKREIRNRIEAIEFLDKIIKTVQLKMNTRIQATDTRLFIGELSNIFTKVYDVYIKQKEARIKLKSINVRDEEVLEMFEINKQICKCLIDGLSIWIENAVIYQSMDGETLENINDINIELLIDAYIYGVASMSFSILHMSQLKGFNPTEFFYGLDVTPNGDIPIQVYKVHPITFHNPIIMGNQSNLYEDRDLQYADSMEIGKKSKKNMEYRLYDI